MAIKIQCPVFSPTHTRSQTYMPSYTQRTALYYNCSVMKLVKLLITFFRRWRQCVSLLFNNRLNVTKEHLFCSTLDGGNRRQTVLWETVWIILTSPHFSEHLSQVLLEELPEIFRNSDYAEYQVSYKIQILAFYHIGLFIFIDHTQLWLDSYIAQLFHSYPVSAGWPKIEFNTFIGTNSLWHKSCNYKFKDVKWFLAS